LAEFGFRVCFVSNSPLSPASETALKPFCERVMIRENTGLDFCMWQAGLAHYDLAQLDELLLTNSSIIGPLQPLSAVWQRPELADCEFWGLTDNDEFKPHLSSYFLVFRQTILRSARFREFWPTVLPYRDKAQVIFSYELGLTQWLSEAGFRWRAAFPQKEVDAAYRAGRSPWQKWREQWRFVSHFHRNRVWPARTTPYFYPDLLMQRGMPFVKTALLRQSSLRFTPAMAFALLEQYGLPADLLAELRRNPCA
jgi:lipopolysaccharide biosynthesis protein